VVLELGDLGLVVDPGPGIVVLGVVAEGGVPGVLVSAGGEASVQQRDEPGVLVRVPPGLAGSGVAQQRGPGLADGLGGERDRLAGGGVEEHRLAGIRLAAGALPEFPEREQWPAPGACGIGAGQLPAAEADLLESQAEGQGQERPAR
jgi:hypothetical protein